jgi:hypothetical protein
MPVVKKIKLDREFGMSWGGACPHPIEDVDIFNRLPTWRQAELRDLHDLVINNPHAQVFCICDPATGKYYPNQSLISNIQHKLNEQRKTLPEVPSEYKYIIPNGVPLGLFTYCYAISPTVEQIHTILLALDLHVTQERLVENCTYNQRLVSDKPLDGVFAFIWRNARFMSGVDSQLPATAFIDLIDGISKLTHIRVDTSSVESIMQFLEGKAEKLVDAVGRDRKASAIRWAKVEGVYNEN